MYKKSFGEEATKEGLLNSVSGAKSGRNRSSTYHLLMKFVREQTQAMGHYKTQLNECKTICKHITSIYKEVEFSETTELVGIISETFLTLNLLNDSINIDFDILNDLFQCLKNYEALLDQLKSTGRLERFLTSNRY